VAGLYILHQRRVSLTKIVQNNQWLTIFLLYCFISIIWSDFPVVALKRWIKVLGHPIMALIVITEPDPGEALIRLMKRCAYVILPVSILFIKYYPQWGRGFESWTGAAVNTGITTNKNALGCDCMILGFFLYWSLLQTWNAEKNSDRRNELILTAGLLAMVWWLLVMAHSSTSLVSLLIGVLMVALLGLRFVNKRLIGTYLIIGAFVLLVAEMAFGIYAHAIQFLGKDPTLTDRTILWNDLLKVEINPLFGTGFESFWLGDRLQILWATRWWHPNEAHNGYLETYLNLGLVGLFLLMGLLIATFWKGRRELLRNFELGRIRLGFLLAVVVYNWTEASFKALSPVWFVFYLTAMDYPQIAWNYLQTTETIRSEADEVSSYGVEEF
jgi:exopolysaccharide production protein ExoQ